MKLKTYIKILNVQNSPNGIDPYGSLIHHLWRIALSRLGSVFNHCLVILMLLQAVTLMTTPYAVSSMVGH